MSTHTNWLMRVVGPATAVFATAYTGGFVYNIALGGADRATAHDPSDIVAAGEVKPGWRYEVFAKDFPSKTYALDVKGLRPGEGSVCAVEVKGYPRPIMAAPGPGTRLRVVFDRPLEGRVASMLEIDLMQGTAMRCAARISNGVVMDEHQPVEVRNFFGEEPAPAPSEAEAPLRARMAVAS